MKVLHVAETFKGGVATVVNSLACYQSGNGDIESVRIVLPAEHVTELSQDLISKALLFKRKKRSIGALFDLSKILYTELKENRPSVVHLHSTFAGLIGRVLIYVLFRKYNIKVIYCPHAFAFLMSSGKIKNKLYINCEKLLTKITDKIICVGESEYKDAAKVGIAIKKMAIINNGVKIPSVENKINNTQCDEYQLLYVGRFDYQKGTDVLIDALKIVDSTPLRYKVKVIMIGDAVNDHNDFRMVRFKNINIDFTGWVKQEDLFKYYLHANCLVIPSRWEGLAMVPLEAISYKLPVIASNINAFNSINDISGLWFESGNKLSLANLLSNLDRYDLNNIKEALYKKITTEYTQELMNEKTLNLYKHILKEDIKL